MIYHPDAPGLEKTLHHKFKDYQVNKINHRKEFFSVNLTDVKKVVEEMGVDVHWTLQAEAQEYRESLALSKKK